MHTSLGICPVTMATSALESMGSDKPRAQLMETLESGEHWGAAVFRRFLKWYVPFFGAYTFVLARAQEYEADRQAADLVGSREFADALITIVVNSAFLDTSFWPAFYKQADNQPEPPASPFIEMSKALRIRNLASSEERLASPGD